MVSRLCYLRQKESHMVRVMGALLAGLLLAQAGPVRAADESPAGSWKLTLPFQGASWLVKLESKDGKWTGTALAGENTPRPRCKT